MVIVLRQSSRDSGNSKGSFLLALAFPSSTIPQMKYRDLCGSMERKINRVPPYKQQQQQQQIDKPKTHPKPNQTTKTKNHAYIHTRFTKVLFYHLCFHIL